MKIGYLGVDVGSVSTNLVVIDDDNNVLAKVYRRTMGQPIKAVQEGLIELKNKLSSEIGIQGVGTTGSARHLAGVIVGADIVKNEITAHAVASGTCVPEVRTVLEIGGQDSKVILLREGIVVDFAMNTVCAAGTGSFLDHQAARIGIPIEEFGDHALKATKGAQIAGRCTVFAESDMIHKQQVGYPIEDIIYGLCQALVRNFLNNLCKGKEVATPIVFQGGVAANAGIRKAFEEALETKIIIPEHFNVMGAVGSAVLAKNRRDRSSTKFKGFETAMLEYKTTSFSCHSCANDCEIIQIKMENRVLARWGGRCDRWEDSTEVEEPKVVAKS